MDMSSRHTAGAPYLRVVREAESVSNARPSTLHDEELVEALRHGDSEKTAALYDRLIPAVDGALVRVLGRREQDHNDLVQSVFEQIIVTLIKGKYHGTCGLVGFASAVSCNVALNALRSRVRERKWVDRSRDAAVEGQQAGAPLDLERQVEARSQLMRLREELAAMSQARATAVLLYDVFGYELAEIAAMTGVSAAAAQSRVVRGRKELHERMGKTEDDARRKP